MLGRWVVRRRRVGILSGCGLPGRVGLWAGEGLPVGALVADVGVAREFADRFGVSVAVRRGALMDSTLDAAGSWVGYDAAGSLTDAELAVEFQLHPGLIGSSAVAVSGADGLGDGDVDVVMGDGDGSGGTRKRGWADFA